MELVFDNSENFLGGEYLKFEEVSVKREMGRDGQSTYFINNAVARRRDVQDLFLGTGLGSNSYAIIEQGIISSLVGANQKNLEVMLRKQQALPSIKREKGKQSRELEGLQKILPDLKT